MWLRAPPLHEGSSSTARTPAYSGLAGSSERKSSHFALTMSPAPAVWQLARRRLSRCASCPPGFSPIHQIRQIHICSRSQSPSQSPSQYHNHRRVDVTVLNSTRRRVFYHVCDWSERRRVTVVSDLTASKAYTRPAGPTCAARWVVLFPGAAQQSTTFRTGNAAPRRHAPPMDGFSFLHVGPRVPFRSE